ncbi:MAG: STAS domain-containing protein [Candidatus Viridilinea halotolerans]|uniref:STAS domain-containing protein n=1 Tax=Candidatus Viridilinea halotolerans TaxID=2491704 RepID=A0A426TVL9_9CHLR|nr:MAG: STAS domain-containing protein [Candidatus Viridilinea halotolerans]
MSARTIFDTTLLNHLRELVLFCDMEGTIRYANAAAQGLAQGALEGVAFLDFLGSESRVKGEHFLQLVQTTGPDAPTEPWELPVGDAMKYVVVYFRGHREHDQLVIIGEQEPPAVNEMQHELLALTSELSQAQREQRRQNRQLAQALSEQRHLLDTIQSLSVPTVPIWDRVLLLPLVGHFDSRRADQVNTLLLNRAAQMRAKFAIIDLSGIALVDTSVAQQLIQSAQALRLLGVQPILVGINPEIAQTVVNLGVSLPGFVIKGDLRDALAFVLYRMGMKTYKTK